MPEVASRPEIPALGVVRRLGAFVIAGLTMFGAYVLAALATIMVTGCFLVCDDPNPWGWLVAAAAVVVLVAGVFGAARLVDARLWALRGIATPVALVGIGLLAHDLVIGGIAATLVLWAPSPSRRGGARPHARVAHRIAATGDERAADGHAGYRPGPAEDAHDGP